MIIMNPGTEGRSGATEANAVKICDQICEHLKIDRSTVLRQPIADDTADGWFAFSFIKPSGERFQVDIPGDDPEQVFLGKPFTTLRLYVDGSSWLYGNALGRIAERVAPAAS